MVLIAFFCGLRSRGRAQGHETWVLRLENDGITKWALCIKSGVGFSTDVMAPELEIGKDPPLVCVKLRSSRPVVWDNVGVKRQHLLKDLNCYEMENA